MNYVFIVQIKEEYETPINLLAFTDEVAAKSLALSANRYNATVPQPAGWSEFEDKATLEGTPEEQALSEWLAGQQAWEAEHPLHKALVAAGFVEQHISFAEKLFVVSAIPLGDLNGLAGS